MTFEQFANRVDRLQSGKEREREREREREKERETERTELQLHREIDLILFCKNFYIFFNQFFSLSSPVLLNWAHLVLDRLRQVLRVETYDVSNFLLSSLRLNFIVIDCCFYCTSDYVCVIALVRACYLIYLVYSLFACELLF